MKKHAGGAPKKPKELHRVTLNCRVDPMTMDYIDELGEIYEQHFGKSISNGQIIDLLARQWTKHRVVKD